MATYWLSSYGYSALICLLMLGIVGLPIPDETLLTFAGFLVNRGEFHLVPTLVAGFIGSCLGISISYTLGRFPALYLINKMGWRISILSEDKMARVEAWFEKYGKWMLTFGYFVPGFRHLVAIVAGASQLRLSVFAFFAYFGALIWTSAFVGLGYCLGENWQRLLNTMHEHIVLAALSCLGIFLLLIAVKAATLKH